MENVLREQSKGQDWDTFDLAAEQILACILSVLRLDYENKSFSIKYSKLVKSFLLCFVVQNGVCCCGPTKTCISESGLRGLWLYTIWLLSPCFSGWNIRLVKTSEKCWKLLLSSFPGDRTMSLQTKLWRPNVRRVSREHVWRPPVGLPTWVTPVWSRLLSRHRFARCCQRFQLGFFVFTSQGKKNSTLSSQCDTKFVSKCSKEGNDSGKMIQTKYEYLWLALNYTLEDLVTFHHSCPLFSFPACQCDPEGTLPEGCNKQTGVCLCRPGITGSRCSSCSRGHCDSFPACESCPSCFFTLDSQRRNLSLALKNITTRFPTTPDSSSVIFGPRILALENRLKLMRESISFPPSTARQVDDALSQLDNLRWGPASLRNVKVFYILVVQGTRKHSIINRLKSHYLISSSVISAEFRNRSCHYHSMTEHDWGSFFLPGISWRRLTMTCHLCRWPLAWIQSWINSSFCLSASQRSIKPRVIAWRTNWAPTIQVSYTSGNKSN